MPDPPEEHEELEDLDPEDLPEVYNLKSLDEVDLGPGQVLALRFSGNTIGRRGTSLRLASDLFADLYRFFTGAQPVAAGLEVQLAGSPPKIPGIEPPVLQGAFAGHSITVVLGIAGKEARTLLYLNESQRQEVVERPAPMPTRSRMKGDVSDDWTAEFPTLAASHWLTEMLSANPAKAARQVQLLGRRATRDFLRITEAISYYELDTGIVSHDRKEPVYVTSSAAWETAERLRRTVEEMTSRFSVLGALYQADARNDRFRLITEEGEVYKGTYVAGMTPLIRDAWAKLVRATLIQVDFRWVGADKPHKTVFELESIDKVLGDADELLS